MTREIKFDRVKDLVCSLDNYDLMYLNNEYCDKSCYSDYYVYSMSEIDDLCYGMKPSDVLETYGDVAKYDFFKCGVYVEGSDYVEDLVDVDDIVDFIIDNEDDLGNTEVADLLNDFAEEADSATNLIEENIEYFVENDPLMNETNDIDELWDGFKTWTLQQVEEELYLDATDFIEDFYESFVNTVEDYIEEE